MVSETQTSPESEVFEFPASSTQASLWVLHQMMPSNSAYNIPLAVKIKGELNLVALEKSVRALVQRHEIFRTRYADSDGQLLQHIYPNYDIDFSIVNNLDQQVATGEDAEVVADRLLQAAVAKNFDLANGEVLRAGVIITGEQAYLFYLVIHHIAVDHSAMLLISNEISQLYAAFCSSTEASSASQVVLPEPELQYADYVMWLQENQDELQQKVEAWREHLEGISGTLALPTDRRRPIIPSGAGAEHRFSLSAGLSEKVIQFSRAQGVTLYSTCLAAFKVLMARYSNQPDIVVGTPFSFRGEQEELQEVVGCILNTLPLASVLDAHMSFNQLLASIKQTMLFAYRYQDVPFDEIVNVAMDVRDFSANPLFQVGFVFQEPPPVLALDNLLCESSDVHTGGAMYDIHQWMWLQDDILHGVMWYSTDIFDIDTIERMQLAYEILLNSLIDAPDASVWQADMLSVADQKVLGQLTIETSETLIRPSTAKEGAGESLSVIRAFPQLFAEQVAVSADKIAAVFSNGVELSYRQLDEQSSQLANLLIEQGVEVGDFVGICMTRTQHMMIALVAVMKSGGVYVPLDPAYPKDRLQFMLETSAAKILLANSAAIDILSSGVAVNTAATILDIESQWQRVQSQPTTIMSRAQCDSLSYVIFTSGSSGKPKGVKVSHGAVMNFLQAMAEQPGFTSDDTLLAVTTLSFDIAVLELFLPLFVGGTVVIASCEQATDAPRLAELIEQHQVSVMQATPGTWRMLLETDWPGNTALKVLCGGEAFPQDLAQQLLPRVGSVWNMYGPTETTVWSTCFEITDTTKPIYIGKPIRNTSCYILDAELNPVPLGVAGELYIGGDGVSDGYLKRADLTAERFVDNPFASGTLYRTGDLVSVTRSGEILYLNRIDNQVKVRGYRMELGEIEAVLSRHSSVAHAVTNVVKFSEIDQRLVAYVVLENGSDLDESLLMDHLRSSLPDYMLPQKFTQMDAFPKTANGKIDRNALPIPQWQDQQRNAIAPETAMEKSIAAIWCELLGLNDVDAVGLNSDFFSLGGHSLLAVTMLLSVNKQFDGNIRVRDFITKPSIANIVALLQQGGTAVTAKTTTVREIHRPAQLPMSSAQRRLWYIEQFTEGFNTYNVQITYDIDGQLDPDLVRRSLYFMAGRHESLRTVFNTDSGQWIQHVAAAEDIVDAADNGRVMQPFAWVSDDISALNEQQRAQRLESKQYDYSRCPFDFESGPLWCAELTTISADHSRLYLVFHHAIFDGVSADIFIEEFVQCYQALERNAQPQLPELQYHYADYVLWQQQQNETNSIEQQYDYWKDKLGGELPVLNLPADFPRPAELDYLGDTCGLSLNAELIAGLEAVANRSQCSLFVVLLATYQLLLHKYTQQDDLLVGCPVAERDQGEFAGVIGFLVNTLVLRTQFSDLETVEDLLTNVRDQWYEAMAHGDVTFDDLVEKLQITRNVSHAPIFQTLFGYHKVAQDTLSISDRSMRLCRPKQTTARADVTFWLEHCDNSIEINCEYSTSNFSRQFATQFLSSYQYLLEQLAVLGSGDQKLTDVTAVTPALADQLNSFCGAGDYYQPTAPDVLAELISAHQGERATSIAVRCDEAELTYGELGQRSNQLAAYLIANGIERGDYVAIALNRRADLLVGLLGILKTGATYVPLDPDYPNDRLAYMLETARVKLVLSETALIDELPEFTANTVYMDQCQDLLAAQPDTAIERVIDKRDIAYVIFTSGSTGKPKGVKVSHGAVMNFLQAMAEQPGFTSDDTLLAVTTLSFDIAVLELFLPLFTGGTVVIASRDQATDAARLAELIEQHQVSVMQATPSTWRMLLEFGWPGNAALKVLCGGEAFPQDLAQQLVPRVGSVWNMYGPTETTVWSTCFEISDATKPIYIGKPIRNTSCYILDTALNPVPPGVAGELYIGGDGVTNGYLHRPDLTAERFLDDPFIDRNEIAFTDLAAPTHKPVPPRMYRTGDKVRWRYDGELEYFNRIDNQVKVRGFRIELGEIESQILAHEAINDCAVVLQMVNNEARLVAFYTCLHDETLTMMQLREFLSQALPRYMLPNHFILEQRLPLTPSGKIDRKALALRTEDNSVSAAAMFKAPVSATEKYYAKVWAECLSIDSVSLDDNFFDIGGHSLMATRVVTRVSRDQGVNLELRSLLMNTLAQIALQYPLNIENDTGMENCVIDADNGIGAECSRGSGINVDSGIIARINYKLKQFLGRL